jgi:hypothetical protein
VAVGDDVDHPRTYHDELGRLSGALPFRLGRLFGGGQMCGAPGGACLPVGLSDRLDPCSVLRRRGGGVGRHGMEC